MRKMESSNHCIIRWSCSLQGGVGSWDIRAVGHGGWQAQGSGYLLTYRIYTLIFSHPFGCTGACWVSISPTL